MTICRESLLWALAGASGWCFAWEYSRDEGRGVRMKQSAAKACKRALLRAWSRKENWSFHPRLSCLDLSKLLIELDRNAETKRTAGCRLTVCRGEIRKNGTTIFSSPHECLVWRALRKSGHCRFVTELEFRPMAIIIILQYILHLLDIMEV